MQSRVTTSECIWVSFATSSSAIQRARVCFSPSRVSDTAWWSDKPLPEAVPPPSLLNKLLTERKPGATNEIHGGNSGAGGDQDRGLRVSARKGRFPGRHCLRRVSRGRTGPAVCPGAGRRHAQASPRPDARASDRCNGQPGSRGQPNQQGAEPAQAAAQAGIGTTAGARPGAGKGTEGERGLVFREVPAQCRALSLVRRVHDFAQGQ